MGTPTSWISLIIDPENLNQEFIRTKTENELFEIIIYLIYNGLNICSSQSNSFLANVDAKIEAEKFATIKFLLFKLLSHFQWNIKLILKNLPSIHQEFLFGEFKKFCFENATVPKEWSHFAEVLFHRWVIAFEQQSTYPGKNNFRRSTNSFNQNMQDPLYVSSEIQENSIKKIQNICPHSSDAQDNRVDDFVEEGEIDDEELVSEDDPELLMLQAIEPEMILQLIPSIERTAEMINPRWHSSKFDQFWTRIIAKSDVHKSSLILAKANELRNAHYFKESRVLYLSLLEDVQASNPLLAEMIRFEILHVDIEMFMAANQDICERNSNELRLRCQYFLRKIGPNSVNFIELIELVCFFLVLNTDISLSEFCIHHCETVRFSSLLKEFSIKSDQRDIFNKLLEFFIGFFLLPNTKFNQNFPKSIFTKSLVNFLCKIDSNLNIILIVSIFLIKFYSIIKDYTFPNVIFSSFQFDSFPIKMSVSLIDCLDKRYITAVLDEILNHYLKRFPENILLNRYFAEYLFAENCYHQALKYYVKVSMLETNCFAEVNRLESISILDQMIICCSKTGHHLQAAILFQFYTAPDYGLAFKELNEINQIDIADDLYECICDINLMEYIVYINAKRGEDERRSLAMDLISEPLFNQNNDATIMNEAAKIRKQKFLRILSRQYLLS
ncbi:integrator complex subunit 8-like protein [Sarcoptes scabiei]|uniref:Integrator complex subunit 8-like protein n=1 Tax=Sarcoptes scabiei TaxID=52283 RepID=A0A132A284_SARSC|nr:integrator complex subunit 8-like protein [Sarcoptes scabiei]